MNLFGKFTDFTDSSVEFMISCAISDHNTSTIVATIFESLETMFEDRESIFMSFIGEDSAHKQGS
ncbi:hypothetical protein KAZ93_04215 [Patescibacteria group bacterium]|nr:hypothetical protein [Patescibacteria group bacterium]